MSFLGGPPDQAKKPFADVLPDGRKRLTRYFQVATTGEVPPRLNLPPKTADEWTDAPTGWTGLLLTYKQFEDQLNQPGSDTRPILQLIFEQISSTAETQTGGTPQTQLPDGRDQVEFTYVMFSTSAYTPLTPGVSTAPAPFTSYYLWTEENTDDGTLRNIKRTYQTAGTTATDDESLQGGALLLKKITSFKTVPSTPSGYTPVGTPVQNPNGYPIYTYTFAKGDGLAAENIRTRNDGLREVTDWSLGSRIAPSGIVIRDDYKKEDGYTVYVVTTMQAADGNADPTTSTYSAQRYVNFTYPGRAKPYSGTFGGRTQLDVFKSPPITTLIKGTVSISYQTSNTITVSDFWNPVEWATINAQWISFGDNPHNLIEALPGYRSTTDTPVTATCSAFAPIDVTIFGNPVYGGTTARVQTTGGPASPDGNTYTLSAEIDPEPAFTSTTGVNYYRYVKIVATIPSQPALPV